MARVTAMTPSLFKREDDNMETRTCPKCSSSMQGDKYLQSLGSETELAGKNSFIGDKVKVF